MADLPAKAVERGAEGLLRASEALRGRGGGILTWFRPCFGVAPTALPFTRPDPFLVVVEPVDGPRDDGGGDRNLWRPLVGGGVVEAEQGKGGRMA
jgi:hypothetical protein